MSELEKCVSVTIGVLCVPISIIILRVLFSPLFAKGKRWHRTGLWWFALAYAALALGILGHMVGLKNGLWIYLLADAAFVAAPCFILVSHALDKRLARHTSLS